MVLEPLISGFTASTKGFDPNRTMRCDRNRNFDEFDPFWDVEFAKQPQIIDFQFESWDFETWDWEKTRNFHQIQKTEISQYESRPYILGFARVGLSTAT